jgi:hypothetical protein
MHFAVESAFPIKEAVDGYSKGFRKGFLCPHCRINLEETGDSNKDITNLRFGFTYLALCIFSYTIVNEGWVVLTLFRYEIANLIVTFLVVLGVPTIALLYINRKTYFGKTIIYTKRVVN